MELLNGPFDWIDVLAIIITLAIVLIWLKGQQQ